MLSTIQQRKAKIVLSDYSYQRDIEARILMAQLSILEVDILKEIVHHSLKISVDQFAKELEIPVDQLIPILDKLSSTKLFKRQHLSLLVDKDMRKYYEFQLEKFDENFKPDLEFLQNVLNQVPIHVLPLWYAIPRSSDNIFASIIEKYFLTPKIFLQYLNELQFDDPVLHSIIKDVYQAPGLKIKASDLIAKYHLSRKCFEEYLLLLEYHFACCLSYEQMNDYWQEVVTPFYELREFLQFEVDKKPQPIKTGVKKSYFTDFNFINDLTTLLTACQTKKVHPKEVNNLKASSSQLQYVVEKLKQVGFVKQSINSLIQATEKGKEWLSKSHPEKVSRLAADPLNTISNVNEYAKLWNIRNLHLVEKKLRRVPPLEWVKLEHFLEGFIAPIGDREPVTLRNKGTKWRYVLPTYTDIEVQFIEAVIMERLAELGVVDIGSHQGQPCICLTAFGYNFIH